MSRHGTLPPDQVSGSTCSHNHHFDFSVLSWPICHLDSHRNIHTPLPLGLSSWVDPSEPGSQRAEASKVQQGSVPACSVHASLLSPAVAFPARTCGSSSTVLLISPHRYLNELSMVHVPTSRVTSPSPAAMQAFWVSLRHPPHLAGGLLSPGIWQWARSLNQQAYF